MKHFLWVVFTLSALSGCTFRSSEASPAPRVEDEAPVTETAAIRTDWREALVQTLASAEAKEWERVEIATGWAWPVFEDYRLYYRGLAQEALGNVTNAVEWYAAVGTTDRKTVFFEAATERHLRAALAAGEAARYITDVSSWASDTHRNSEQLSRRLVVGRYYEALGKYAQAVDLYREIYLMYPAYNAADEASVRLAELEEQGFAAAPLTDDERRDRADRLFSSRAWSSAYSAYHELIPQARDKAEKQLFSLRRGISQFYSRNYRAAHEIFRLAAKIDSNSEHGLEARFFEGYTNSRLGRPDAAVDVYTALTNADSAKGTVWAERAQFKIGLVHLQEGNDAQAVKHFKRYLDRFTSASDRPDALWWVAWAEYNRGNFEAAKDAFEKRATFRDRTALSARYWAARADGNLGNKVKAEQALAKVIEEAPLHYYGLLASARLGRASLAPDRKPFFEKPVTQSVDEIARYHLDRGVTLTELGRHTEAEREYRVAALSSRGREAALVAARALVSVGRYHAAQRLIWAHFEPELLRQDVVYTDLWELVYPRAFDQIVQAKADEFGTDPLIVMALMREESRYQPDVMSPANAHGLLQLIIPTAERVAERLGLANPSAQALYDPELNITLGTAYISSLLSAYGHNFFLAFAGYNGGPQSVNRWLEQRKGTELDEFVENIPYTETRNYVKKVTTSLLRYRFLYSPDIEVSLPFLTVAVSPDDRADGVR